MGNPPKTRDTGSVAFDLDALNQALLDWGAVLRDDDGNRVVPTQAMLKHEVADLIHGEDAFKHPEPKFVDRAFRGCRIKHTNAILLARALGADLSDLTAVSLPQELLAEDWLRLLDRCGDDGLVIEPRSGRQRVNEAYTVRKGATDARDPTGMQLPLGSDYRLRFTRGIACDQHAVLLQFTEEGCYAMLPSEHWPEPPIPAGRDRLNRLPGDGDGDWLGLEDRGRNRFLLIVAGEPLIDDPRGWIALGKRVSEQRLEQLARRVQHLSGKVTVSQAEVDGV